MASLDLDNNKAMYQIRAYQPGIIQVNEKRLTHSVVVTPDQLIENWPPQTVTELTAASLAFLIDLKPDVLLIGTGTTLTLLPAAIYGDLINAGIGVEIMDTSAACRTYNALSAEDRNVIAVLIIR